MRSPLINVMVAAAQKAARRMVRDFGEVEQLQVSRKGPADFVSNADHMAERKLIEELRHARPEYSFLTEERGVIAGSDERNRWIVDPLDGTTNFLHGIPHFAISIALERDKDLVAGVIYSPVAVEMFWAEKGQGAYLNGRRIRVSARSRLADALFATGIPFMGKNDHELFIKHIKAVMAQTSGVRRFGAASLDLAWVAAGRYDGYWEKGINAWDMAAGIVIVREAGGFVHDLKGGNKMLQRGDILATNDPFYDQLRRILRQAENA